MVQGNPRQLPRQSAYETVYQLPDTYQYADARQRNQGRDDIFVHESAARFAVLSTESSSIRAPAAREPAGQQKTAASEQSRKTAAREPAGQQKIAPAAREPAGQQKTAPAAPDRDSIAQPI